MDTTLRVADTTVHVEGEGDDVIVMIHGWPDTFRVWDQQVAHFRDRYRCVRFTLPGFDRADPREGHSLDDVIARFVAILDAVQPNRPVILMLHDWGCVFGYQLLMRHPDRVARVIGIDIGDGGSKAQVASLGVKGKALVVGYQLWLVLAWRLGGGLGDWMSRRMARWMRSPAPQEPIGSQMNYPYDIAWTGSFGSFRGARPVDPPCPMLYVYGTRKPFFFHSQEWLDTISSRPGSAVHALRSEHWVMLDAKPEFHRIVDAWLSADRS